MADQINMEQFTLEEEEIHTYMMESINPTLREVADNLDWPYREARSTLDSLLTKLRNDGWFDKIDAQWPSINANVYKADSPFYRPLKAFTFLLSLENRHPKEEDFKEEDFEEKRFEENEFIVFEKRINGLIQRQAEIVDRQAALLNSMNTKMTLFKERMDKFNSEFKHHTHRFDLILEAKKGG